MGRTAQDALSSVAVDREKGCQTSGKAHGEFPTGWHMHLNAFTDRDQIAEMRERQARAKRNQYYVVAFGFVFALTMAIAFASVLQ